MRLLIQAYFEYAWGIAVLHAFFLLICIGLRVIEYLRLKRELRAFSEVKPDDTFATSFLTNSEAVSFETTNLQSSNTEVEGIIYSVVSMARKGQLLDPDRIRNRLARSYGRYDIAVRTCINGFVVSGLLGTLYNLWKLGPAFWDQIIAGNVDPSKPAIGVAFSSSVIGLSLALAVSVIDSCVILSRRESLIRRISNSLSAIAIGVLPPTESAAVAQALVNFYDASRGFLEKLRVSQEEFSAAFIKQISDSSDRLGETLTSVSTNWTILTNHATSTLEQSGRELTGECKTLTNVIADSARVLEQANNMSREAEELAAVLLQIRSEAATQRIQLNDQMDQLREKWINDLATVTDSHLARLNESYENLWSSYTQQDITWREQSVLTLQAFAEKIEGSINEWGKDRDALSALVETMVTHWQANIDKSVEAVASSLTSVDARQQEMLREWRQQLGTSITQVQTGLADLIYQVDRLKAMPSELQSVYDTSAQQLGTLGDAITTITSRIAEGSPVSETVNTLREAVLEFQTLMRQNGRIHWPDADPRQPSSSASTSDLVNIMKSVVTSNSHIHDDLVAIQNLIRGISALDGRKRTIGPAIGAVERPSLGMRFRRKLRKILRGKLRD